MSEIPQVDFSAGIVRATARHLIPENGLYDCVNGLLDGDGQVYQRGGSEYVTSAFGTSLRWVWDGHLGPGQRTLVASPTAFGVVSGGSVVSLGGGGLSEPVTAAEIDGLLFIGGGHVYGGSRKAADYATGTVGVTLGSKTVTKASGFTANVDAGMLLDTGDGRFYRVANVVNDTTLTLAQAYAGTTAAAQPFTFRRLAAVAGSDYLEGSSYAVVGERLFVLQGSAVLFSEGRDPSTFELRPHLFPAFNSHDLPAGAQGLGLSVVRDRLLIFTTAGMYVLTGTALPIVDPSGNPQHRLELAAPTVVLAGLPADWNGVTIAPASQGIYLLDGLSAPVLLSASIEPFWREYVRLGYTGGKCTTFGAHLFMPVIDSVGAVKDLLVCRLDRSLRTRLGIVYPWTRFSGQAATCAAFAVQQIAGAQPVLLCGDATGRLLDMTEVFTPGPGFNTDADGTYPLLDLISRRFVTGPGVSGLVQRLAVLYSITGAGKLTAFSQIGDSVDTGATWDDVTWDDFSWGPESDAGYEALMGSAPANDASLAPYVWPVNRMAPMIAFRLTATGTPTNVVVRQIKPVLLDNLRSN